MATTRAIAAKLKKLLRSRTLDGVRTAVELAISLDDEAIIDALLQGVTYSQTKPSSFMRDWPDGDITLGPATRSLPKKLSHLATLAMLGLIARGKGESAKKLRGEVESIFLASDGSSEGIDLELLAGLDLRSLVIMNLPIWNLGALGTLKNLEHAHITPPNQTMNMEGIAGASGLQKLVLYYEGSLKPLEGLEHLDTLEITSKRLDNVDSLARLPRLSNLHIRTPDLPALPGLPCESIRIETQTTTHITVGPMPRLSTLELYGRKSGLQSVRLSSAPKLWTLIVRGSTEQVQLVTEEPLPSLHTMRLQRVKIQDPASFPNVTTLRGTPDLEGLRELPKLETLELGSVATLMPLHSMKLAEFDFDGRGIRSLMGHPHAHGPKMREFHSLTSLVGIGNLLGIRMLYLNGCQELTSLDGIEELSSLRALDLRHCTNLTDISALAGMDLGIIAIAHTSLRRELFPEALRKAVTKARHPTFNRHVLHVRPRRFDLR